MSYARWGCDGSDVYVYGTDYVDPDNKGRVVEAWVCMHLGDVEGNQDEASFSCRTREEMIAHLLAHRERGDTVPEYALERLREEIEEQS